MEGRCTHALRALKRSHSIAQTLPMFRLAPEPIPDDFIWNHKYEHLTYKGFIEKEKLLSMVANATSTPLNGWSIAWEDTSTVREDGVREVGYQHTHFAMMFKARLNLKGLRKFDICIEDDDHFVVEVIHPHVQPKVTIGAMEAIFTNYHQGRKWDIKTGSYTYTKPVYLEQKLPSMFDFNRCALEEMCNAPSLFEACIAGQIKARTVNDVKT